MTIAPIICRVCKSQETRDWQTAKDFNEEKSDELFAYRYCMDCGSIFLGLVPADLKKFYGQDYRPYTVRNSQKIEILSRNIDGAKLEVVKRYVSSGKLIEVGPAAGGFLSLAAQEGFTVLGVEKDPGSVDHIKNALLLDAVCSDDPGRELSRLPDSCDVIVAWQVIEHLPDLQGFAGAASKALRKPSGVIMISTPNPQALSFKVFGRYWAHLDAPRHLTLIPLAALDRLMASYGLERVACIFGDSVERFQSRTGWQGSLTNLAREKKTRPLILAKLLGRILAYAMSLFDQISRNSATYTAIYRHKPIIS